MQGDISFDLEAYTSEPESFIEDLISSAVGLVGKKVTLNLIYGFDSPETLVIRLVKD